VNPIAAVHWRLTDFYQVPNREAGNRFANTVPTRGFQRKFRFSSKWLILLAPRAGHTRGSKIKRLDCQTSVNGTIEAQDVSAALANAQSADFEPIEHSVYFGRQRLGRYSRVATRRYAAFDADERPLGAFSKRKDAWAAIGRAAVGAAQ
jgi:hypothetical protein